MDQFSIPIAKFIEGIAGGATSQAELRAKRLEEQKKALNDLRAKELSSAGDTIPFETALDRYQRLTGKSEALTVPGFEPGQPIPYKAAQIAVGGFDPGLQLGSAWEGLSPQEQKYAPPELKKKLEGSGPIGATQAEKTRKVVSPLKDYNMNFSLNDEGLKRLADVDVAAGLFSNLTDDLSKAQNQNDFGTIVKEKAAQYFPEVTKNIEGLEGISDYQKNMLLTMETFLRQATGAATNPSEYVTYYQFIPKISDSPKLKQQKIEKMLDRTATKALWYVIPQIEYANLPRQKKDEMILRLKNDVSKTLRPVLEKAAQFGEIQPGAQGEQGAGSQVDELMKRQDAIMQRIEELKGRK